ncbi:MAG: tilS [Fibrobacteres bacterium]|nr:tilS [Fibrobacterota bacterium]
MEMWARRERYGFFEDAARDAGATWILTAHHRDDLVETVFQRLGRGTGPRGLKGIPFRRGGIVRPFLNRSRAEILAYLGLMEADWREDESNADIGIDRNWYRHRFLPGLRLSEPGLDERIHSMAMTIQEIGKGIDALEAEEGLLQTDGEGEPYLTRDGVEAKVAAGDLEGLEFWMRTLLTSERADPEGLGASRSSAGLSHTAPSIGSIPVTKEILREFCRQWEIGPESLQVPLNRILALKCQNNGVYRAERALAASNGRGRPKKTCSPEAQRVILVGGSASAEWRWGDRSYSLVARRFPRPAGLDFPSDMEERAIFDADLISCTLLIRTRKDGDRFSPLGIVSRSRKLKTFFNEEKVPTGMRDVIPIVFSGEMPGDETLAWVPGYGISDFFKVSGSTSHILELVLTCENP